MQSEMFTREVDRLRMKLAEMRSMVHVSQPDCVSLIDNAFQIFSRTLDELVAAVEDLEQSHTTLLQANKIAELERQRYIALFEHAPLGYLVLDRVGNIQVCNATACHLLRTPQELLVGQSLMGLVQNGDKRALGAFLRSRARNRPGAAVDLHIKGSPPEEGVVLRLSEPSDPRRQPGELWVMVFGTSKWEFNPETNQPGVVRLPC